MAEEESKSGLDALRKKFESGGAPIMGVKPAVASQGNAPAVARRWGGGGNVSACNGIVNKDSGKQSQDKSDSAIVNSKVVKRDGDSIQNRGFQAKRNSKVNIPDAFRNNSEPPIKPNPKPALTPKPKSDNNNNASSSTSSSTASGKMDIARRFERKTSDSDQVNSTRKNSVGKPSGHEDWKPVIGEKPNSPRGVNVLQMASQSTVADLKSRLKPVGAKVDGKPVPLQRNLSDTSENVELRNKQNKFGNRTSDKRKSVKSVIRNLDGKKFHRIEVGTLNDSSKPPEKPDSLDFEIDLEALVEDFKKALQVIGIFI